MTIDELDELPESEAREMLTRCCGSTLWVQGMLARRPWGSKAGLLAAADAAWTPTKEADWLEAFAHHPRIGGKDALREKFAATKDWSRGEQSAVAAADEATLDALARGNADYEAKFGFIFIVCATGKTAAQMLDLLNARLPNERRAELLNAAHEQTKITKIRLEKLLS